MITDEHYNPKHGFFTCTLTLGESRFAIYCGRAYFVIYAFGRSSHEKRRLYTHSSGPPIRTREEMAKHLEAIDITSVLLELRL